jgi:hypothetical protein
MARITTYFSGKDDLQAILLKHLSDARSTIHVAVAWLTDVPLFNQLLERQRAGVRVELIITRHEFNAQCSNDHEAIGENGGLFLQLGTDDRLMHHKFCIIDRKLVLQGSFNWTKRANQGNNETLTLIEEDPPSVNQFLAEFERMTREAGAGPDGNGLQLAEAYKYFQLLRAFIGLGRTAEVNAYAHELRGHDDLEAIKAMLLQGAYPEGLAAMAAFEKRNQTLVDVTAMEREYLLSRIRMLNALVSQLVGERAEVEATVSQWWHRYHAEINPILVKILALKKKLFDKLKKYGVVDRTMEELEEEFEKVEEEFQAAQEVHVAQLTEDELSDIKSMHREAAKLCHPDSTQCVFEDKRQAAEVFSRLSQAFKANDIATVREILMQLRTGNWIGVDDRGTLDALRAQLATLEQRYADLLRDLEQLKTTEPYVTIEGTKDWDAYFESEKYRLLEEYQEMERKYTQ